MAFYSLQTMSGLNDARRLMQIFQGSDLAFGRSNVTRKTNGKGKLEAHSWMEKRPVTEEDWRRHVEGIAGLGIAPINSQSKVRFGAIDVDVYAGLDLGDLCRDIADAGLPLVVCRSKSGGPHLYLFVSDWVPARLMVEKLDMLAGFLGFGSSEIFPKQVSIGTNGSQEHPDYGNWINMPYFNGSEGGRFGLDKKGDPIKDVALFSALVEESTITPKQLEDLKPAVKDEDAVFPGGPPCLNNIFQQKRALEGQRNILLCNLAVYAKKAFPDNWKDKVDEFNRLFPQPLPGREVEAIKRSYERKEYRYQCRKSPLCDFCNSQVCKDREFGIETGDILPNNRSLTVINTSPPVWFLDVATGNEETRRISLSTEELQNPRYFQKRCMEVLKIFPPVPKAEDWADTVQSLLNHVTEIDIPKEMTPVGILLEHLDSFLGERSSSDTPEDMLRGLVFSSPLEYWFRWIDFKQYLDRQRFDLLKQNQILAILKTDLGMVKDYQKIKGKGCNYIRLPKAAFTASEPEALTVKQAAEPF